MRRSVVIRTFGALATTALAACGGTTEPVGRQSYAIQLIATQAPRFDTAFTVSRDTLVIEVRDNTGKLAANVDVFTDSTSGWLKKVGTTEWLRAPILTTDSTGYVRALWRASGATIQRLFLNGASFSASPLSREVFVTRAGVDLQADTAVTSGEGATCVQKGGRVGCIGDGLCISCGTSAHLAHEPGRLHWFGFSAPLTSITSTIGGACALLTNGNTACWDGLGPDSIASTDTGHPPFVELKGGAGRTADGKVWVSPSVLAFTNTPRPSGNRPWLAVPSDSTIVSLLYQYGDTMVCGLTASRVVMCGTIAVSAGVNPSRTRPMTIVKFFDTNAPQKALGGYTDEVSGVSSFQNRLFVSRLDTSSVVFSRSTSDTTDWTGIATFSSELAGGPDPRVRLLFPGELLLGSGDLWRSVSQGGRTYTLHLSYESGYRRTCGIREVILCKTYVARGYQRSPLITYDTIRVAQ